MSPICSHAETRLETQKLGPLQIRVALLCMLAQIFDGFDISSISMAVPALIKAWHLPGAAFANTFVMTSVELDMVGAALLWVPPGDRAGRKPVLLASLLVLPRGVIAGLCAGRLRSATWRAALHHRPGHRFPLLPGDRRSNVDYLPDHQRRRRNDRVHLARPPLAGFVGGPRWSPFSCRPTAGASLHDRWRAAAAAGARSSRVAAGSPRSC